LKTTKALLPKVYSNLKTKDFLTRWYNHPTVARFTTVDPLAEKAAAWNPYRYAFNNPLTFIDPTDIKPTSTNGFNLDMWEGKGVSYNGQLGPVALSYGGNIMNEQKGKEQFYKFGELYETGTFTGGSGNISLKPKIRPKLGVDLSFDFTRTKNIYKSR
jgi:hypothetical protein